MLADKIDFNHSYFGLHSLMQLCVNLHEILQFQTDKLVKGRRCYYPKHTEKGDKL